MTHDELKSRRKAHGLSVTQAARLVHVSDRTWQRYESGRQPIPEGVVALFDLKVDRSTT